MSEFSDKMKQKAQDLSPEAKKLVIKIIEKENSYSDQGKREQLPERFVEMALKLIK